MSTTRRIVGRSPGEARGFAEGILVQTGAISEREMADTDDVWPLELWLSREEEFVEDDTWHAGRARDRSRPGRGLRSLATEARSLMGAIFTAGLSR
jgi:hypothetical protein